MEYENSQMNLNENRRAHNIESQPYPRCAQWVKEHYKYLGFHRANGYI